MRVLVDLVYKQPFYYDKAKGVDVKEAFCPRCWEADGRQVHLIGPTKATHGDTYGCPECGRFYDITSSNEGWLRMPPAPKG